jgi:FAD/FMN-containing dehydrogenase
MNERASTKLPWEDIKTNLEMADLGGQTKSVAKEDINTFAASLRGRLMTREAAGYDEARSVWNAMIDKKPALIARCAGVADVMEAVEFAATRKLRLAVRGAGHNIAGTAICEDGLLIDLSQWRSVKVDPTTRTVRVEPGATLGDLDHETQAFGLATPSGINSTTGIAGLTLGGGLGWLSRKHGLTIDNLRSADVVTADGALRRCSPTENADLFWAIRGGGGNFGVITSFEFTLHEVGPTVTAGLLIYPFEEAESVLQHYRRCTQTLSDDVTIWMVQRQAPPLPALPAKWHGKEVVILATCHVGASTAAEKELEELREWGEPIVDLIGPHTFASWQQAFDPVLTPGERNYWKSHNFTEISDDVIDLIVDYGGRLPSNQTEIFFAKLGGAVNRVAPDGTAYPHRDTEFVMNVHARWSDAKDDARCMAWAREFFQATKPHASGGVYVNFIPEDEDRVANAYGPNLARLKELKKKYDPHNLFRINQNITTLHAKSDAPRPARF